MFALKLAGVDVVLLHLTPQGGATNIQQLRHLLYSPTGDTGGMDNRLFFDSGKRQAGWQQGRRGLQTGTLGKQIIR